MKTLLTILILLTSNAIAQTKYFYYVEVFDASGTQTVNIEFATYADAETAIPDILTEFVDYPHTTQIHSHYHGNPEEPNLPCEVTPSPLANGDKYVEVSTDPDPTHKIAEFVRQDYTDDADADKKADKVKKSKWFKDKVTKTEKKVKDK